MSGCLAFVSILLSLAGLVYFLITDPKRRRTLDLPKMERRPFLWPARCAAFGPGVFLMSIGHWSGFSIWAGAITTLGWAMAAVTPQTYAALLKDLRSKLQGGVAKTKELCRHLQCLPTQYVLDRLRALRLNPSFLTRAAAKISASGEINELKARVEYLEARLRKLEKKEDVALVFSEAEESHKAQFEN